MSILCPRKLITRKLGLEPFIEDELIKDIDNSIEIIASLINRRTHQSAIHALEDMEEPYASDVDYYMTEYVDYIRKNYGNEAKE